VNLFFPGIEHDHRIIDDLVAYMVKTDGDVERDIVAQE